MVDVIIEKLIDNIKQSNNNKSSHWKLLLPKEKNLSDYQHLDYQISKYYNKNNDFNNKLENLGAGSFTLKSYKSIFYKLIQKVIYGNKIFKTNTYKKYKNIFDAHNRFINNDTIRHIFTFDKLKNKINPESVCIIGDGKLNGLLGAHLTFPNAKIFTVNLSEMLINDYLIIKEIGIDVIKSVTLVDNQKHINTSSKIYLVPSNQKNFLLNKNIDLFINIASFQEMQNHEINSYFSIMKNNKSNLYCCNREYKKLSGGEEIYFDKYPWGNIEKKFWGNCDWHQKYFNFKFPFIHRYDGNVKHCLISFK